MGLIGTGKATTNCFPDDTDQAVRARRENRRSGSRGDSEENGSGVKTRQKTFCQKAALTGSSKPRIIGIGVAPCQPAPGRCSVVRVEFFNWIPGAAFFFAGTIAGRGHGQNVGGPCGRFLHVPPKFRRRSAGPKRAHPIFSKAPSGPLILAG